MRSNEEKERDAITVKKVPDPDRPGQAMLVWEEELICCECNKTGLAVAKNPLSERAMEPEKREIKDVKTGKVIKTVEHYPFTVPLLSCIQWRPVIPWGWFMITTLPRIGWPYDFIAAVKKKVPIEVALEQHVDASRKYGRWYCCARCMLIGETKLLSERYKWSKFVTWWRLLIIKILFW